MLNNFPWAFQAALFPGALKRVQCLHSPIHRSLMGVQLSKRSSAKEVADGIRSLGVTYDSCALTSLANGVDGATLMDIELCLEDLLDGVDSKKVVLKRLARELKQLRGKDAGQGITPNMLELDSHLRQDLTCPLTLELFVDPISVPCCGKAFERASLVQTLQHAGRCPLCNGNLCVFDAEAAAKNVLLAGMVRTLGGDTAGEVKDEPSKHNWTCTATPVVASASMCELSLNLEHAKFSTRPSLFIAVLDRSGSMGGRPGNQVLVSRL
jgi:hypothetical protein